MFQGFSRRVGLVTELMKKSLGELTEQFAGKSLDIMVGRLVLLDSQQKEILHVINRELKKGPLGGYIAITAVVRYPRPNEEIAGFSFQHQPLVSHFKITNRMKAYAGYLERFKKQHEALLIDHFQRNQ